jgi:hypothetical protein
MPRPCRAAKGLECVFPIWFTQCGYVWFTLVILCPRHALTMPFFSRPCNSMAVKEMACGLPAHVQLFPATMQSSMKDTALSEQGRGTTWDVWINGTAWQGNGMGTACYVWIGLDSDSSPFPIIYWCSDDGKMVRPCVLRYQIGIYSPLLAFCPLFLIFLI